MSPDPSQSPPAQFHNIWTLPNFGFETSKIAVLTKLCCDIRQLKIYDYFHWNISAKYFGRLSFQYFLVYYQHFQSHKNILEYFGLQRLPEINSLWEFPSFKGIFIFPSDITMVVSSYQEIKKKFVILYTTSRIYPLNREIKGVNNNKSKKKNCNYAVFDLFPNLNRTFKGF